MRPHPRSKKRYWRDRRTHDRRHAPDWLCRAIFNLFPVTDWKNNIPVFPGSTNTGIIWGNIAAGHIPYSQGDCILGGSIARDTERVLPPLTFEYDLDGSGRMSADISLVAKPMPDAEITQVYCADDEGYKKYMRGFEQPYPQPNRTLFAYEQETGKILYEYIGPAYPPNNWKCGFK